MTRKSEILTGKKILFLSSTDFSHRTREFREAMTLHNAGAQVSVFGFAVNVPQLWASSPIQAEVFMPQAIGAIASNNSIWAVRVFMNLTINILRSALRKFVLRDVAKRGFYNRARSFHPDVIHAMDLPSLKDAAIIAKETNAKLVYDSSEYWIGFVKNPAFRSRNGITYDYLEDEKENISKANLICTTSPTMSRKLEEVYGVHNFCCLYNAPIVNDFVSGNGFSESGLKLVFHGGIGPDRNLDGLLEALAMVPEDVTLDIYGNIFPDYEKSCLDHVHKLKLGSRITFHGKFDYGEMLSFLEGFDAGIYPAMAVDGNFDVTLPNKVFDCVCAGLALITPDFISMKEFMDEAQCGFCIDTTEPEKIAEAILELRNNKEILASFKKRAAEIASNFSWEAQEEKLLTGYEDLIKK